jgi:hypothetical protein
MPPKASNSKQDAGRARKADVAAKKQSAEQEKSTAQEAALWQDGANVRRATRDQTAAQRGEEVERKRREKIELEAAEAATLAGVVSTKKSAKPMPTTTTMGKKKKNPDLAFLEDALQKDGEKLAKKKKQDALKKQQQAATTASKSEPLLLGPVDPLLRNTQEMIGVSSDTNVDDSEFVGRLANVARMQDNTGASGIDAALETLSISSAPLKKVSAKALYNEFEARMLPKIKDDYPGLRLTQYKDKIWSLWKKSPENPANYPPAGA